MENIKPKLDLAKIVPLARKKLLAQALVKDSPVKCSIKQRKFLHHSTHLSQTSMESFKKSSYSSLISSPLKEKDLNKPLLIPADPQPSKTLQDFLIKLWKCKKMNLEAETLLKFEVERSYYSLKFREEHPRLTFLVSELQNHFQSKSQFPEYLYPYLEEVICTTHLTYPLITSSMSLFEAESLLSLSICRFSTKKIKALAKIKNPSDDLKAYAWVFLLLASELEESLQECLRKLEDKPWELLLEYLQNPGQVVQTIRKFPEMIRKGSLSQRKFYIGILQRSFIKYSKHATGTTQIGALELQQLLGELFEYNDIYIKSVPEPQSRIKRIKPKSVSLLNSSRSSTPNASKINEGSILIKKGKHSRSFSRICFDKKSQESDKRMLFLQGSRFNKRVVEALTEELIGKMTQDPQYLIEVKNKDPIKYLSFKQEYVEIHQDVWVKECIKALEKSEILSICTENDLKLIDAKKEAFFSYVCDAGLVRSIVEKARSAVFK